MKKKIVLLLSLFLLFPISVSASSEVILGGESIGIVMEYDGVMITGTYSIKTDNQEYNPKQDDFKNGDLITSVDGKKIKSIDDLNMIIKNYKKPINKIPIIIKRNNQEIKKELTTVYQRDMNAYQSGLYVKDEITGVGTMTYYDPNLKTYGALGHSIDGNQVPMVGSLYDSTVTGIIPSKPNDAGEKTATIDYNNKIATVSLNDTIGLYGTYQKEGKGKKVEIGSKENVHKGKAQIYTVLNGKDVESFDVEITQVNIQDQKDVKGIELKVTDQSLIKKTGGIVQGMSGSPIVQDDKVIGALTHVITNDPTRAYGVYIEFMKEQSDQL